MEKVNNMYYLYINKNGIPEISQERLNSSDKIEIYATPIKVDAESKLNKYMKGIK